MKRTTIALALTLFMVLAGTGVSNAFWSAQATTTSGVSAGAIGISQSGFESLQVTYNATALVAAAPITVTNTGTIAAPYTLTLAAQTANSLASGVQVRTWAVGAAGECAVSAAVPSGATDTNWTNIPALTGTLAPAAQKVYCVRTSITSPQQTSLAATSLVGALNLESTLGSWSASDTAVTGAQAVADTAAPSVPGTPIATATTNIQTTLTWAASTDNVGVTAYDVYRGGVLLATVTSPIFTDTGLSAATSYSYTIEAKDAAGSFSAASAATSVTTLGLTSSLGYKIKPANGTGLCLDGSKEPPVHGTTLVTATCNGNSQPWNVVSVGGYYSIVHPTKAFVWAITEGSLIDGAGARLEADTGATNQQWEILADSAAGLYRLVNRASAKCLETPGSSAVLGTQLQQKTCNGSAAQAFTLVP